MPVQYNEEGIVLIREEGTNDSERSESEESGEDLILGPQEQYNVWVDNWARKVRPCKHNIKEVEQYFLKNWDAEPFHPDDTQMRRFHRTVVMNHLAPCILPEMKEVSFDMTQKEMEQWYEEERRRCSKIWSQSFDGLDLRMSGYYVTKTPRNMVEYDGAYQKWAQYEMGILEKQARADWEDKNICVFFEETTEHIKVQGGGIIILNPLIVYQGVSEEDIKFRTFRFHSYLNALYQMGEIPGFQ